jgi:hypothetical protein
MLPKDGVHLRFFALAPVHVASPSFYRSALILRRRHRDACLGSMCCKAQSGGVMTIAVQTIVLTALRTRHCL